MVDDVFDFVWVDEVCYFEFFCEFDVFWVDVDVDDFVCVDYFCVLDYV